MSTAPLEHRPPPLPQASSYAMTTAYDVNDEERPLSGEVRTEGSSSSSSSSRATSKPKSSGSRKRKAPDSQSKGGATTKRSRTQSFTALPTSRQLSLAVAAGSRLMSTRRQAIEPKDTAESQQKVTETWSMVQKHRCYTPRYKTGLSVPSCIACIRRQAGDTCRFMNVRIILFNSKDEVAGHFYKKPTTQGDVAELSPKLLFPTEWNIPFGFTHARRTKRTIAQALLPTLKQELEHLRLKDDEDEVAWRPLESDVRATCDTCMTSIFSCAWMCRLCGREACSDCHERLLQMTAGPTPSPDALQTITNTPKEGDADEASKSEFLQCSYRRSHTHKNFMRTSRFTTDQLEGVVKEMEEILAQPDPDALPDVEPEHRPLQALDLSQHHSPPSHEPQDASFSLAEPSSTDDPELSLQYPPPEQDIFMADIAIAATTLPSRTVELHLANGDDVLSSRITPPLTEDEIVEDRVGSASSHPSPLTAPTLDVCVATPQSTPFTFSLPLDGLSSLPAPSSYGTYETAPPILPVETIDVPSPSTSPSTSPSFARNTTSASIENPLSQGARRRDVSLPPIAYLPFHTGRTLPSSDGSAASTPMVASLPLLDQPSSLAPPLASADVATEILLDQVSPAPVEDPALAQASPEPELPIMNDPSGVPSHPTPTFTDEALTEDAFRRIWIHGTPIVVTGLLPKFHVQWTPRYFMDTYGAQECVIVECQSERTKQVTVGKFFEMFGRRTQLVGPKDAVWKLKDWPPSSDFKVSFPELYADFARAVPVPNYTRRDGVLNVASHFPSNTVAPDIGPKMYNAQATFETEGSNGSTRLHMDMADAVNMMLYAERGPDGRAGCAAWDLFRAEDADILRQYLRKKFGEPECGDPIHAQKYYLDAGMRKELFDEFGVKSFRVYQFPGQAVFIPAGCAHQVCNLADCIKVAADFVSPENISKCARLTEEFRRVNVAKVWKEDVLQLRMMMWFAWLSCSRGA